MRSYKSVMAAAILLAQAGVAFAEPGVTPTEIKIGEVNMLSGPTSILGRASVLGAQVAIAEINEKGGVNGRKITLITEDDGYVPARSFQALTKLLEVDQIFALVGGSGTANALAMMPLITKANLPALITTAPDVSMYTPLRPSVFTIGASYGEAFFAMMKYIHEKIEPKDAVYGLIRQDDDFGVAVEKGYSRAITELKLKDGIRVRFKRGQADFGAEMLQLKNAGVNVLANGGVTSGAANILKEARRLGMDIVVGDVWSDAIPQTAKLMAPAGYPYIVADYVSNLADSASEGFMASARKHLQPGDIAGLSRWSVLGYVGMKALAKGMEGCGANLTRECTIEKLRQLEGLESGGLMAPISFKNEHQLSGTALKIYQFDPATMRFTARTEFQKY